MSTNFPTSLDSLTNPTSTDTLNSVTVPHASQHANANDAIEALEAKVGVDGSLVTTSLDYRVGQLELGGGGVTDHGALTGLADDDHTQYHTDARGDARYSALGHNHAGVYEPANAAILKTTDIGTLVAPQVAGISTTEIGYLDNVTSNIQTQLNGKSDTSHNHSVTALTGWPVALSTTELGYLDGVTSAIQTQIDGKAASSHTQTLSTISDWPAAISTTEIGYLDNATSNIQAQLDAKLQTTSLGYLLKTTDIGVLVQPFSAAILKTTDIGTLVQSQLVSGTNIKTINSTSLLGSGDIAISGGSSTLTISNKTTAYTVISSDNGTIINCTSGTFTVSLTAAATLGAGFNCWIWNTSSTITNAITIAPATETIDGKTTLILRRGEGVQIVCDGTNWQTGDKKAMRAYAENFDRTDTRPVASADGAIAIGKTATSSGTTSFSAGFGATASATNAIALGRDATANTASAAAFGTNSAGAGSLAAGTAAMALGGSYASGTDSFAAAGADNSGTYGAQGANSIAIGKQAKATGSSAVAIGLTTSATTTYALAIGAGAIASGTNATALGGFSATAGSNYSTAIGVGSTGSNGATTATGAGAMALGGSYASGADSFAAAIANNTSSYGATGANSVVLGKTGKASGTGAVCLSANYLASGALASGTGSVAIGDGATASAGSSLSLGSMQNIYAPNATGIGATAIGSGAKAVEIGKFAYSSTDYVASVSWASGAAQTGAIVLRQTTTGNTATAITSDAQTAANNNQLILPNNSAYAFEGIIVARRQAASGTESAAWKVEGLIRREGTAATTTLVASTVTAISNVPGWTLALSADTTNGGLAVTFTGAAATNIRAVATIRSSEVTYA